MRTKTYLIETRRYTAGEDVDDHHECDDIFEAHRYLQNERAHGTFRAWVNGREIEGAGRGDFTAEDLMAAYDPFAAALTASLMGLVKLGAHIATNPATYAAAGQPL